jgi:hypothetical protein
MLTYAHMRRYYEAMLRAMLDDTPIVAISDGC